MPHKKIINFIKFAIFAVFLATEFFGFGYFVMPVFAVGATCSASIVFDAKVGPDQSVTLSGSVSISKTGVIKYLSCYYKDSLGSYDSPMTSVKVSFSPAQLADPIVLNFPENIPNDPYAMPFNISVTPAQKGFAAAKTLQITAQVSATDKDYIFTTSAPPINVVLQSAAPPSSPSPPTTPPAGGTPPPGGGTPAPALSTDCTGGAQNCLYNPLPEDSLTGTLLLVTRGFLGVIGLWAVAFIIFGGFQMVMAAGNEEAILKAKKTITWAVIGLIVALLAFSIIAIVQNLLNATVNPVKL